MSAVPRRDSSETPIPPRLRDRLREQTRAAIIDAAEEILVEQGLDARIDAIAVHAGVAVGTLYNHFSDRDAIVRAVVQQNREELFAVLDEVLKEPRASFAEDVGAYLKAMVAHTRRHGPLLTVLMNDRAVSPNSELYRCEFVEPLRQRALTLVQRGLQSGALAAQEPELVADVLLGFSRVSVMRSLRHGRPSEPELLARFFLHGVGEKS